MAASDIFNLNKSVAPRAISRLYAVALILIALGVILGLVRGIGLISHGMMPRPAVTATATPGAATPAAPAPQADAGRPPAQAMRGPGRGFHGRHFRDRRRFMMMRRHPVGYGIFMILRTLVGGAVLLLLVRILAEMGLAVLAMPRRSVG